MVDEKMIARINELARKQKSDKGLTPEEKKEQAKLRAAYIHAVKESTRAHLDRIKYVDDIDDANEKKN